MSKEAPVVEVNKEPSPTSTALAKPTPSSRYRITDPATKKSGRYRKGNKRFFMPIFLVSSYSYPEDTRFIVRKHRKKATFLTQISF